MRLVQWGTMNPIGNETSLNNRVRENYHCLGQMSMGHYCSDLFLETRNRVTCTLGCR